jgi:hypothetical protein
MSLQLYRFYGANSDKGFTKSFETHVEAFEFAKTLPPEVIYDPSYGVPNPPPVVFWWDNGDWITWDEHDGCWRYNSYVSNLLHQKHVPHMRPDGSFTK